MRPLRLIFVDGRAAPLDPHRSPTATGGGITTALYTLTRILARRGHDVTVVGPVAAPSVVDGVAWHDRRQLPGLAAAAPPDALIVIPDLLALLLPIPARTRFAWSGNAFTSGDVAVTKPWSWAEHLGRSGQRARLWPIRLYPEAVDRFVVKSHWQAGQVNRSSGISLDRMTVLYNGVPDVFFGTGYPAARRGARLIYTSQARRGLSVLLALFPDIRAAVPDAELHVFGYDAPSRGAPLVAPSGVTFCGAVDKAELAAALREATVFVYPCTLAETFCTSVAEAQAAGLPVVATRHGALAERVDDGRDGYLVDGPAGDPLAHRAFVDAVVTLLRDEPLRWRMGEQAAAKARRSYDWQAVGLEWERQLLAACDRPVSVPTLDAGLDLLDPENLRLSDRGEEGQVPAGVAEQWLRADWASYGLDPAGAPGLPHRPVPN